MQSLLFSLKRAHQATLRLSRRVLKPHGLTPARYDLLHALKRRKHGMAQGRLEKVLGVTPPTVSRMLRSLEQLGLVRREVDPRDGRCKLVWLTDAGRTRLDAAYKEVVRPGWIRFALDWTLGTRRHGALLPPIFCFEEMWELDQRLVKIRRGFADTGSLAYVR